MMTLEQLDALAPDYEYVDDDRVVVTIGFAASFFFWGGHTEAKREALVACIETFEAAYGDALRFGTDPNTGKMKHWAGTEPLPSLRAYVRELDEDDCIEWHRASNTEREEVGEYAISCMTERGWHEGHISWLGFQVPRALVFDTEKRKVLEALLLQCHETLQPFHGTAGFAALTPLLAVPFEPDVLDLATRYACVYIDGGTADQRCAPNGLKSVNWLTFVSDDLAERLGGPAAFATHCARAGAPAIHYGRGFILRAGDMPEIAPVGEPIPEAYVRVNNALRPLRDGGYDTMGSGSINGEQRFDRCTSDLWIRRFDVPDIWPPASFIGLGKEPLGKAPTKKVRLKTGEQCTVAGRYARPEADAPELLLMPGDLAPYHLRLGPHGEDLGRDAVTWELRAKL